MLCTNFPYFSVIQQLIYKLPYSAWQGDSAVIWGDHAGLRKHQNLSLTLCV